MKQNFRIAAEHAVASLQKEFEGLLVGVLAAGSAVHDNTGTRSDLDLVCVLAGKKRKMRVTTLNGIAVEIAIRPLQTIRESFLDTNIPDMLHMFATGEILHDPQGALRELTELAKKIWAAGRPGIPLLSPTGERLRYIPFDLLDDAEDLLSRDPEAAVYVMHSALEATLDLVFRLSRQWFCKPKTRLEDLAAFNPGMAHNVRKFLQAPAAKEQWTLLKKIVEDAVKPLGGRLKDWETPWELLTAQHTWELAEATTASADPKEDDA